MSDEARVFMMRSCVSSYFVGAKCGRDAAEIVSGRRLTEEEWEEYGKLWDDGWDKMLLDGEHLKTEKKMNRKEAREKLSSMGVLMKQVGVSAKAGVAKGQNELAKLLPHLPQNNVTRPNSEQITERLESLSHLRDGGVITEAEYIAQRQRILDEI